MGRSALAFLVLLLISPAARGQHDQHRPAQQDTTHAGHREEMHREEGQDAPHAMEMPSALLPDLPMQRDASGTSWHPDTAPMYAIHTQAGDWNLMFHGSLFGRYTAQDVFQSGERGDTELDAPNWLMAMGQRTLSRNDQIAVRAMLSFDPITEGGAGYPLLFQTGETFEGQPLIDRQHPHDFFSELAVAYGHAFGNGLGVIAYFGLPGEPALGPPAFMHRTSARHNPDSPLGHHLQDATHIIFGTATLGFRFGIFKLDGSLFTGSEPDEERFGIDRPRLNSYSARLAANPTDRLALQVSRGFLKSPEALEPDVDLWRTTASAMYDVPLSPGSNWATTFVWGMNEPAGHHAPGEEHAEETLHSFLLESDLQMGKQAFYTRLEWVDRAAHDLGIDLTADRVFSIGALTLGTARDLFTFRDLKLALGGQGMFFRVPDDLQPIYGESPIAFEVYLQLTPTLMRMSMGGGPTGTGHGMH